MNKKEIEIFKQRRALILDNVDYDISRYALDAVSAKRLFDKLNKFLEEVQELLLDKNLDCFEIFIAFEKIVNKFAEDDNQAIRLYNLIISMRGRQLLYAHNWNVCSEFFKLIDSKLRAIERVRENQEIETLLEQVMYHGLKKLPELLNRMENERSAECIIKYLNFIERYQRNLLKNNPEPNS
jgi:hypothetical protein